MSEWISVRDRLPKKYSECIIFTVKRGVEFSAFDTDFMGFYTICDYCDKQNPTHWKPKPSPPEEK